MARRGPKRDDAARRRILDATRELICEHGPGRVTINQITASAHVGKQTIYRWWPSRSALVVDALADLVEEQAFITVEGDPVDTRQAVAHHMRRLAGTFASPAGAMIRELVSDSQRDPAIAHLFHQHFLDDRRARATAILRKGIENGELRDDLAIDTMLDVLYAPFWFRLLLDQERLSPDLGEEVLDIVWAGLTPRR